MDQYTLMRMSENQDDDAYDEADIEDLEDQEPEDFREDYREFYDDIKVHIREDW